MEADAGWVPLPPGDPEPLRQALALSQGTNGDIIARVGLVTPPVVERKGMFGRTKTVEVEWGCELVHYSDVDGSGEFSGMVRLPPGPPLAQRMALPPGVSADADAEHAVINFDVSMSAAAVAAALVTMLAAVFGDIPGGWQVCAETTTYD